MHRENRGSRTLPFNRLPDLSEAKETDPWEILVKAHIVNTHPPFLILLLYKYRVY
jgi:hypothetical protein